MHSSPVECKTLFFFFPYHPPESQVQLGPGDRGADSRIFFLGLHRDTNPGRIHLLQAGGEQVSQHGSTQRTAPVQPEEELGLLGLFNQIPEQLASLLPPSLSLYHHLFPLFSSRSNRKGTKMKTCGVELFRRNKNIKYRQNKS